MGFWASLATGVGNAVGGNTGSVIKDVGEGIDLAGQVVNNSGKTAAQNQQLRYAQDQEAAKEQTQKDQLALAAKIAKQNGDAQAATTAIAEQKAADTARTEANAAAVRGALQKHIQDVTFNTSALPGVPNLSFSGGLRPSAFGPELAQAGTSLNASGQKELDNPPAFPVSAPVTEYQQTQPTVPPPPDQTIWEKLAGPLGLGLTVAGTGLAHAPSTSPTTITPNAPGGGRSPDAGATAAPADLASIIAFLSQHPPAQQPQQTDPTLGRGVNFGPGVIPSGLTPNFGSGVTFGGG